MKREKRLTKRYIIPLLVILAVFIAALAVVPTLARYLRGADDVKNNFTAVGSDKPIVNDDYTITVGNKGYPVYVRVKVLITWKNADGKVLYLEPEEYDEKAKTETEAKGKVYHYDYSLTFNDESVWKPMKSYDSDEDREIMYYYYIGTNSDSLKGVVKSSGKTEALINEFVDNTEADGYKYELPFDGYKLNLEIIVQTVQAVGRTDDDTLAACEDAWKLPPYSLRAKPKEDPNEETNP